MKRYFIIFLILILNSCITYSEFIEKENYSIHYYCDELKDSHFFTIYFAKSIKDIRGYEELKSKYGNKIRFIVLGDSLEVFNSIPIKPDHTFIRTINKKTIICYRYYIPAGRSEYVDIYIENNVIINIKVTRKHAIPV